MRKIFTIFAKNQQMKLPTIIIPAVLAMLAACSSAKADRNVAEAETPAEAASTFSADSAYEYVARQVAFGPRVSGMPGHMQCADWLVAELERHGADTVTVQRGTVKRHDGTPLEIANIMARFNPEAQKRVIIAAHYDTRPWADAEADAALHNSPIPGANDGASGAGVILELARQMGLKRPDIGVDLLLVDAEDSGISGAEEDESGSSWCLGTQYWAERQPYTAYDRPLYGIVLDMVGGRGARFHREAISQQAVPSLVDRVWGLAARLGHGDVFVNEMGSPVLDDHLFLIQAGIPTIDIIENQNAATGTFPPYWHTMGDDMTQIDRATLRAVGETMATLIYSEKP